MVKGKKEPKMIDARQVRHSNQKLWLWIIWLIVMVISAAYCALSFVTFKEFRSVYNASCTSSDHRIWAPLVATILTASMIVIFFLLGSFILLRKTWAETGWTYSFGVIHISTLWMAALILQSALTLQGFKSVAEDWESTEWRVSGGELSGPDPATCIDWDSSSTTLLQSTYVFGYILAVFYLLLFILFFVFWSAVRKLKLKEEEEKVAAKVEAVSPPPPAPAPVKGKEAMPAPKAEPALKPEPAPTEPVKAAEVHEAEKPKLGAAEESKPPADYV